MKTILEKDEVISTKSNSTKSKHSGFSLIEVMISALILSTAILGIAGLQIIGMRGTEQSLMKQQAMGIVQNMIERMRSNQAGVIAGNYVLDSSAFNCGQALPNCSGAICSPDQIAIVDQLNLVCGVHAGGGAHTGGVKVTSATDNAMLVNGTLDIACINCAVGDISITIGWTEREIGQEESPLADSLMINTRVVSQP